MSGIKLDGAYVPADGSYGLRLEISGSSFLLLWRNSPVLDTKFKTAAEGEEVKLIPKDNGLRNAAGQDPYATLTDCRLSGDKIILTEFFPISGESVTEMKKTEDSRYGRVTIENETVLPMLKGVWADERGFLKLKFDGETVTVNGEEKVKIAVTRYIGDTSNNWHIVNKDPSKDYISHFIPFDFDGSTIRTGIPVCDAPTMWIYLTKQK